MRNAIDALVLLAAAAALGSCGRDSPDQNIAIDINDADPSDIEAVPADETSAAPAGELDNAAGNADALNAN